MPQKACDIDSQRTLYDGEPRRLEIILPMDQNKISCQVRPPHQVCLEIMIDVPALEERLTNDPYIHVRNAFQDRLANTTRLTCSQCFRPDIEDGSFTTYAACRVLDGVGNIL